MEQNNEENEVKTSENVYNDVLVSNDEIKEKKAKKGIAKYIILSIVFLLIGIVSGIGLIKVLNGNVKDNSFMYDVLKNNGLLTSNNLPVKDDTATDTDAPISTPTNCSPGTVSDASNMNFIKSKNDIDYYYYKTKEGTYVYYYAVSGENVFYYYATDANAGLMDKTYMDGKSSKKYRVKDYVGKKFDDIKDEYWDEDYFVDVMFVPNSDYEEGEVYYQSTKAGDYTAYYSYESNRWEYTDVIILVNKANNE